MPLLQRKLMIFWAVLDRLRQEIKAGHPFPLLRAGEATPGALWSLLDSLIPESHGHTGESPAKSHEGSGASLL